MKTIGYAAQSAKEPLAPFHFERRNLRDDDVAIDILYCGVCHSDLHQVKDDWGFGMFPCVPGHEIVGRVSSVGPAVTKYKKGDHVAVGCFVDSCLHCDQCEGGDEQFCREGVTMTYGSNDKISGSVTYGGFSKNIVVREHFVLSVSDSLDLSRAAPILCAGITMYSPLKRYGVVDGRCRRVGVIGIGGLGHMAIKLAKAMGAEVTVISRSSKKADSAKKYGADKVVISTDEDSMAKAASSMELIISTIPVKHDVTPYLSLLDVKGTLVITGHPGPLEEPNAIAMIFGNKSISGSLVGGIPDTQEVLDFCARHNIHPQCEMIRMDQINEAFKRLERGELSHRFVIDMASFKSTSD